MIHIISDDGTDQFLLSDKWRNRFYEKVLQRDDESCWEWLGAPSGKGYGELQVEGKRMSAHRISFLIHHGPIPAGQVVCHRCDYRSCVNPEHLFIGTYADNSRDMVRKGRSAIGERNGQGKLTKPGAIAIFNLRAEGLSQYAIAERIGVSQRTVWDVLSGRTWSHVRDELAGLHREGAAA